MKAKQAVDDMRPTGAFEYVSKDPSEPLHSDEQGFWFFDEVWCDRHGPYPTLDEAKTAISAYAATL